MESPTKISSEAVEHRGEKRILLRFAYDYKLQKELQNHFSARYSSTHKCWHITSKPGIIKQIERFFNQTVVFESDNPSELNFQNDPTIDIQSGINHSLSQVLPETKYTRAVSKPLPKHLPALQEHHISKIESLRTWMLSRRYSTSTIKTYTEGLALFLRYMDQKPVELISNEDLLDFDRNYILAHHLSPSFQNQVINAVKLFFARIELRSMHIERIFRPKRAKQLPNVLSKEEIKMILNAQSNLKHKLMLSLIYACGLRRGELLALKLKDVDEKRGLLIIRQGKGKKDRITPLSEKIYSLIENYCIAYKPKEWLFEGQDLKGPYDERSLASVLKQALEKCGILKPVTLHWLRHSYATHLLESGTDLRYIQELLGHSRSTTTEIYTHVSNKNLQKIVSPFDSL